MVSEAHSMSFPCTELLLFNYANVKTVFYGTFKKASYDPFNRGLCANTYVLHHCVCHLTLFPFRA